MTDALFFNSTLAELSKLTASVRALSADSKVPAAAKYPALRSHDLKMPDIQIRAIAGGDKEEDGEQQDYFTLNFRTLGTPVRKYTVHVSSVRTVSQVKRHLSKISSIPVDSMRLVLAGKGLVDTKLIGDYNVRGDSVIQIISKAAGSATPPLAGTAGDDDGLMRANSNSLGDEVSNPLLTALGRSEPADRDAVMKKSIAGLRDTPDDTSDASSDAEDQSTLTQATRTQLTKSDSAFRSELRRLAHAQFSPNQATLVDSLLDTYFKTLH
ncbi:hypothetical protein IWW48_003421 [Coemansia sp. RSA 1200]|nr:hypothetical protein IWW48_003421 [Coemansia sp. RSA 1200]